MFSNPPSTSEGNLVNMANAIGDLRALGDSSSPSMTVNLPDGRSILGQSGVESKVSNRMRFSDLTATFIVSF